MSEFVLVSHHFLSDSCENMDIDHQHGKQLLVITPIFDPFFFETVVICVGDTEWQLAEAISPHGVSNVVNNLDFSSSRINQKPLFESTFEITVASVSWALG